MEVTLTQIQWDGRPAMYSVWRDMGDSQRAAENLRRAKQLMESVIQNIPAVVFLKRADDLRFELFNRAGEELLGYRAEQVLGKTDADLFPPQQADLFADSDRQALAAAETLDIPESVVATAQGELRCLYVRKTALRDAAAMPRICSALPSTSPSGNKPKKRCGSPQSRSRPTRRS